MAISRPKLTLKEADFIYPASKLYCVLIILFTEDFKIVTIENKRGYDIPGGHIEAFDFSIEAAARRELMEEAHMTAGDLIVIGILECNYSSNPNADLTYMVIMAGFIDEIKDFIPSEEIFNRRIISQQEFLKHYKAADVNLMKQMIEVSAKTLNTR